MGQEDRGIRGPCQLAGALDVTPGEPPEFAAVTAIP
jgi:hypothetical protein